MVFDGATAAYLLDRASGWGSDETFDIYSGSCDFLGRVLHPHARNGSLLVVLNSHLRISRVGSTLIRDKKNVMDDTLGLFTSLEGK